MYLATRSDTGRRHQLRPDEREQPSADGGVASVWLRPTLVALGLTSFFTDIASEMVASILPVWLTEQVGIGLVGLGVLDGGLTLIGVLLVVVGGLIADRIGRPRTVAAAGYGISAAARGVLATTPLVVPALVVDRLGKGLRVAPRDVMIAAQATASDRARTFAVHRAFDTAGALVGPLLAFALLWFVPGDYDLVVEVAVVASCVGVVVLVAGVPGSTGGRTRPTDGAHGSVVLPPPPSISSSDGPSPIGRLAAAVGVLGLGSVGDGLLFLAVWRSTDLVPSLFPLFFVASAVAYLVAVAPAARLADRVGRSRVLVPAQIPLALCHLAIAAGFVGGPVAAVVVLALHGIHHAATDGVASAVAADLAPSDRVGRSIGTVLVAAAAGRLCGAAAFGFLWSTVGMATALVVATLVLGAGSVAAGRLLRGIPRAAS